MHFRTYVPAQVQPSLDHTILKKYIQQLNRQLMQPIIDNKIHVDDYVQDLQPTIEKTHKEQDNLLEKRYASLFSALERAKANYVKYKIALEQLKAQIDQSAQLQRVVSDVQNYQSYSEKLKADIQAQENNIAEQLKRCKILKKVIKVKHQALNEQNSKNLSLLRQITQTRNHLKKQKSQPITKPKEIRQSSQQYDRNEQQWLNELRNENQQLRLQLHQRQNSHYLRGELFSECMQSMRKWFERSQRVVKDKGLQGSLIFEIEKAKLGNMGKRTKSKSELSCRQVRSLVHDTLNKMCNMPQERSLSLDWDAYKQFGPIQIMAAMCLRPKIFEDFSIRMSRRTQS